MWSQGTVQFVYNVISNGMPTLNDNFVSEVHDISMCAVFMEWHNVIMSTFIAWRPDLFSHQRPNLRRDFLGISVKFNNHVVVKYWHMVCAYVSH